MNDFNESSKINKLPLYVMGLTITFILVSSIYTVSKKRHEKALPVGKKHVTKLKVLHFEVYESIKTSDSTNYKILQF